MCVTSRYFSADPWLAWTAPGGIDDGLRVEEGISSGEGLDITVPKGENVDCVRGVGVRRRSSDGPGIWRGIVMIVVGDWIEIVDFGSLLMMRRRRSLESKGVWIYLRSKALTSSSDAARAAQKLCRLAKAEKRSM